MSSLPEARSLISDTVGTVVVRLLGIGMTFLATTVAARLLGPDELGCYAAGISLTVLLATLVPLGTDRVLVRTLSLNSQDASAATEIAAVHAVALLLSLVAILALVTVQIAGPAVVGGGNWTRIVWCAMVALVPQTVVYLRQWIAIPLLGSRAAVMPEQTFLPAATAAIMGLLTAGGVRMTAEGGIVIYAGSLSAIWVCTMMQPRLRRLFREAVGTVPQVSSMISARIRAGLPFLTVAVGAVWTQSCVPVVVAAACGLQEAAFLSLAMPLASLAIIPLGVVNLSMLPRFARLHQAADHQGAEQLARQTAAITFGLAVCTSLLILAGSPMLTLILGDRYMQVPKLLPALLLAGIVDALTGPTIPVMQTMGMQRDYARALFWYCPVQFLLITLMGRSGGAGGAALAYLGSRIFWNLLVVWRISRRKGILMLPGGMGDLIAVAGRKFPQLATRIPGSQESSITEERGRTESAKAA